MGRLAHWLDQPSTTAKSVLDPLGRWSVKRRLTATGGTEMEYSPDDQYGGADWPREDGEDETSRGYPDFYGYSDEQRKAQLDRMAQLERKWFS